MSSLLWIRKWAAIAKSGNKMRELLSGDELEVVLNLCEFRLVVYLDKNPIPKTQYEGEKLVEAVVPKAYHELVKPIQSEKADYLSIQRMGRDLSRIIHESGLPEGFKKELREINRWLGRHCHSNHKFAEDSLGSGIPMSWSTMDKSVFVGNFVNKLEIYLSSFRADPEEIKKKDRAILGHVMSILKEWSPGYPEIKSLVADYPDGIEKHGEKWRADEIGLAFKSAIQWADYEHADLSEDDRNKKALGKVLSETHPDVIKKLQPLTMVSNKLCLAARLLANQAIDLVAVGYDGDDMWTEKAAELRALVDRVRDHEKPLTETLGFKRQVGREVQIGLVRNLEDQIAERLSSPSADYIEKSIMVTGKKLIDSLMPVLDDPKVKLAMSQVLVDPEEARDILKDSIKRFSRTGKKMMEERRAMSI